MDEHAAAPRAEDRLGRRSLRLALVAILVALAPLALLARLTTARAQDAVRDEVDLRLRVTTNMSASLLAEQLASFVTLAEAEAGRARLVRAVGSGDPDRFDDAEIGRELSALFGSRPGIASSALLDLDGVLRACPQAPELVGRDFTHRDYYRGLVAKGPAGDTHVSEAFESTQSGHPLIVTIATWVRAPGPDGGARGRPAAILLLGGPARRRPAPGRPRRRRPGSQPLGGRPQRQDPGRPGRPPARPATGRRRAHRPGRVHPGRAGRRRRPRRPPRAGRPPPGRPDRLDGVRGRAPRRGLPPGGRHPRHRAGHRHPARAGRGRRHPAAAPAPAAPVAGRGGPGRGPRPGPRRLPAQDRVPVPGQPRAADPAQRHPRVRPAAAARRPHPGAVRERRPHGPWRPAPAGADQRGPGHLPDRDRQPGPVGRGGRPARGHHRDHRPDRAPGRRARDHPRGPGPRGVPLGRPGRPPAAQAGAAQSGLQRRQVQPPRWPHRHRLRPRGRGPDRRDRVRHRPRHPAREDGAAVPALRPPRRRADRRPGHRPRPGPVPGADGGHGRHPHRHQRRGPGDHLHPRPGPRRPPGRRGRPAPARAARPRPGPGRRSEHTILYVEDNPSNLRLVERVLARRGGVRLLAAPEGEIVQELVRQQRPDLILLDLHLPGIDGEEVLRRLRADPRTADLPVVMVSADVNPWYRERLLEAGADDYLTKPLDVPRFLEVVDGLLVPAGR